jgi:hypothetical protein
MLRLAPVHWMFWRSPLATRGALAARFAVAAMAVTLLLLPVVSPAYFYAADEIYQFVETSNFSGWMTKPGPHPRLILLVPIAGAFAYLLAWAWAGDGVRLRFSAVRGLLCTALTYLYVAMAVSVLSYFVSDERPSFLVTSLAAVVFVPWLWLLPVIGTVTGQWLRRASAPAEPLRGDSGAQSTAKRTVALQRVLNPALLSLLIPMLVLAFPLLHESADKRLARESLAMADKVHALFDAGDGEGIYAMLSPQSMALVDRQAFVERVQLVRREVGELTPTVAPATARTRPGEEVARSRRSKRWRIFTGSQLFELSNDRQGARAEAGETLVFDLSEGRPRLYAISVWPLGRVPALRLSMPERTCQWRKEPLLHCALHTEPLPRILFY